MSGSPFTAPAATTLRGIIIRDEHDRVIVQASAPEIKAFAPTQGQRVDLRQVDVRLRGRMDLLSRFRQEHPAEILLDPQGMLYNEAGQPVAVMRSVIQENMGDMVEVTSYGMSERAFVQRTPMIAVTLRIEAEGLPGVRVL